MTQRGFGSDNGAGVHPTVLAAMSAANQGHTVAYGHDPHTTAAQRQFQTHFGQESQVFFVFNGTAANVLSLKAMTRSYQAVITADTAHIQNDECGAPEKYTGCKLLVVPTTDGKLTVEAIERHLHGIGFEHHVQPRVVALTQPTEMGTVYRPKEIRAIVDFAHSNNLLVHMDGARLANAAAFLKCSLRHISSDAGVDVLSFGGTKNGMMFGEAVVFFSPEPARDFKYIRKQGMQLASKMRFIAAQFTALLSDDLWLKNARHANAMARLLADGVADVTTIEITQRVESNGVFAVVPKPLIDPLQRRHFFYTWDETRSEVRWMTAFDTTVEDAHNFSSDIRSLAAELKHAR